jgi:hypothetical protein
MTQQIQILATVLFAIAILHTFCATKFHAIAHRIDSEDGPGTVRSNLFRVLGEVEVVFGIWAGVFISLFAFFQGYEPAIAYVEGLDFTEAAFVFVIMTVAATRSIQNLASRGIESAAQALCRISRHLNAPQAFYIVALTLGPLLGSLITEPAAMTVVALILEKKFFKGRVSERFKYKTLALLFVNVSIGGVLTHFAAPPVVMVAKIWGWNTPYLFTHFGYQAAIAVVLNTAVTLYLLRKDFKLLGTQAFPAEEPLATPAWVTALHICFLVLVVLTAHHMAVFIGIFLLFIGVMSITEPHQDTLQIRQSLLVGFFLAGLVVLGKPQGWWLAPLITSLTETPLFVGATFLTAFTDNAALTYLGAQVPNLSDSLKHALVAGAVTGGGLTVIANAPNPAGYGILKDRFGDNGIHPGRLALAALLPTVIAALCLRLL